MRIQPSDFCNLNCAGCPCKKYNRHGTIDEYPLIPLSTLLLHVLKYFDPKSVVLEITGGGEPSMRTGWVLFVKLLDKYGYVGQIRTNGIIETPKTKGFIRITAWHGANNADNPPPYFDKILILKNPNDDWQKKVEYCEHRGITYVLADYKDHNLPLKERKTEENDKAGKCNNKYIKRIWAIYADGNCRACDRRIPKGKHPNIMQGAIPKLEVCHSNCPMAYDVEWHMTGEIKEHCERYYAEQLRRLE